MRFRNPVLQTTPKLEPGKFPGGYVWGVLFRLPAPANADGYIIQELDVSEQGATDTGAAGRNAMHYWEAWPVSRNRAVTDKSGRQTLAEFIRSQGGTPPGGAAMTTPLNDFFFRTYAAANSGTRIMRAVAAFYDERLPADFVVEPKTGAGLPPTTKKPSFWQGKGEPASCGSNTISQPAGARRATLQTAIDGDPHDRRRIPIRQSCGPRRRRRCYRDGFFPFASP